MLSPTWLKRTTKRIASEAQKAPSPSTAPMSATNRPGNTRATPLLFLSLLVSLATALYPPVRFFAYFGVDLAARRNSRSLLISYFLSFGLSTSD